MNPLHLNQNGMMELVAHAGLMAKFVLLLLLFASVFSWTVIFSKWRTIRRVRKENEKFLYLFWNSKNVDDIYSKSEKYPSSPIASLFQAGFRELKKFTSADGSAGGGFEVENINRALLRAANGEVSNLEKHVGWLATTASATPFVGLFGTVWGIMNSFQSIGVTGSANLAVVAPGISEALITTAAGLGAAIPAVVAYNHFAGQIKRVAIDMDCFTHDFLNIIQRSVVKRHKETATNESK